MDPLAWSLTLVGFAAGVALAFVTKTRRTVILWLSVTFVLLVYPFWHIPGVAGHLERQFLALAILALGLLWYGKQAWPATPTWEIRAYLAPVDRPYQAGTVLGGIRWAAHYIDIRLDFVNGPVPIRNLDFNVSLSENVMIAGVGQLGNIPRLTANAPLAVPAVWLGGPNANIPVDAVIAGPPISNQYHVNCERLFRNTTLQLIIAGVASNPPGPGELLPAQLFAPRRPPEFINLEGTCETFPSDGALSYQVRFFKQFTAEEGIAANDNQ